MDYQNDTLYVQRAMLFLNLQATHRVTLTNASAHHKQAQHMGVTTTELGFDKQ